MTPGARPPTTTLDEAGRAALAAELGEAPEATISLHALLTGDGIARAIGDRAPFPAALVAWTDTYDWPFGYGDPRLIVELLMGHDPWQAVCVRRRDADAVAAAIEERTGVAPRRAGELFYRLDRPPEPRHASPARGLGPDDLHLLAPTAAALEVGDPRLLLERRIAAGVVVDDRVVALASNHASSGLYGDIAIATLEDHRRRGYASACASLVAQRVFAAGRYPVWCTGEENIASQRTAAALGFREVERRVNVFRP
jgi:hypothetical protein